jgi:hypothetical protein
LPAGGRGGDDSGDAPWASKTSVYALLNSEVPVKIPAPRTAVEEEEDPMHIMKKQKKLKKVGRTLSEIFHSIPWSRSSVSLLISN